MEEDYFNILREDMLANYRGAQTRMAKVERGFVNPMPFSLLTGEAKEYYTSILCFDLVKFSDLTKTGSDNTNAALLLHTVVPTVMKVLSDLRGIIVVSSGDQITSLFGLESREAGIAAKSALQAALYITNFIEHIADRFIGRMLPNGLRCSIGIDQGPVQIAAVGRKGAHSLVPLGPPVHIAQTLHLLAGDNEIRVGENFYKSLEPGFRERFFEETPVDGWPWVSTETSEPYRAYRFVEQEGD